MTAPVNPEVSKARRLALMPSFSASLAPPGPWVAAASCAGRAPLHDPPGRGEKAAATAARLEAARAVCRSCPVLRECREWTAITPRAKVAGVLAGVYFPALAAGQPGSRSRTTIFPVESNVA